MTRNSLPRLLVPLVFALITLSTAQSQPLAPASTPDIQQRRSTGLAVLREAISTSRDLAQPVNRIYIEANCIQLLWDVDEPLARSLVKSLEERYRDLSRQMAAASRNQRNILQSAYGMRRQVVSTVAAHDATLALDFLRNTRPAQTSNGNEEADLELTLAAQAARQNAKLAADLVRNSSIQNSGMLVQALDQLYEADPATATQAANDLVRKLATANLSDRQTFFAAIQLLQAYSNRTPQGTDEITRQYVFSTTGGRMPGRSAVITTTGLQPLAQAIIAATQKPGFPADLQQTVQNILPTLEKFSPSLASALGSTAKNNSGNRAGSPNQFWQQLNEIAEHGTLQQGIEFAQSVPPEMRWQAYDRIANKLTTEGNVASARELIQGAEIAPEQRQQILENVSRNAMWAAANQGLFTQARAVAANIEDPDERAVMLTQMAQNARGRQQPDTARQLLEEARGLMPDAPGDLQEMNVFVQLAGAYVDLDAGRAGEILESLVTTVNQKLPALAIADGFTWGQRSFAGNEMLMQVGPASEMMRGISNTLAMLAVSNPDRAIGIAGELQRPEARTLAYVEIARRLLTQNPQPRQLRAGFTTGIVVR